MSLPPRIVWCLVPLLLILGIGCGPAHRFRPADTIARGMVEVGGGVGAGVRMDDGTFGGGELQGWIRGGVDNHVEIGGRFFSYMLTSFGGALDVRVAPVKGPIDISIDLSLLAGACCGVGQRNATVAAGFGVDGGFSVGRRFGGTWAPAVYFSPHIQMSWTVPLEKDWPKQLFLPIGMDIPVGRSPFRIRPEILGVGLFYKQGVSEWRLSGGVGIAITGPGVKLARKLRQDKVARDAAAAEEAEDASEAEDVEVVE